MKKKNLIKKVEKLMYIGFGATAMSVSMSNGVITDGVIFTRDRTIKDILDLLEKHIPEKDLSTATACK